MSEMLVGVGLYDLYILYLFHAPVPRLSPLTCCVSCSSPRLFAHVLCNSPYRLKQAQNMSGSVLLTTEASQLSVWIAEVAYYIENPKTTSKRIIFMELFDILEMLRKLAILCK